MKRRVKNRTTTGFDPLELRVVMFVYLFCIVVGFILLLLRDPCFADLILKMAVEASIARDQQRVV